MAQAAFLTSAFSSGFQVSGDAQLAGSSTASVSVSGVLNNASSLSASLVTSVSVSASLKINSGLAGSVTAQTAVVANLNLGLNLSGSALVNNSVVSAGLSSIKALAGQVFTTTNAFANASISISLNGSASATNTLTAVLIRSVLAYGATTYTKKLPGVLNAFALNAAPLNGAASQTVSAITFQVAPARVLLFRLASGACSATATANGVPSYSIGLQGALQAAANAWGTASLVVPLNGQPISATAVSAAALAIFEHLSAAISVTGSVTPAELVYLKELEASVQALWAGQGTLRLEELLAGVAFAISPFDHDHVRVFPGHAILIEATVDGVVVGNVFVEAVTLSAYVESLAMTATAESINLEQAA